MKRLPFSEGEAEPIAEYGSVRANAAAIAAGEGEAHVYRVHIEPGGQIGSHPAGFGQLFFVTAGSGWVADGAGERWQLSAGEGAFIAKGEVHAKGSDAGMTALMIQVSDLELTD
ncbi:MAG TPA: cupin domain-containing protein [Actinomycetota bacterium]|jgi:quercetin dioxygenase-like cupin family protein|nr:cupin domain-containing protein [Actinomycetota bacterium]